MQKQFYLLIIIAIFSSCNQATNSSEIESKISEDSIQTTIESAQPLEVKINLDSIDKANSASIVASGEDITKAFVNLKDGDSSINLIANMKRDHRIFGYAAPDPKSERLILFSIFTNEVAENPFGCKLGAYYDTNGMDGLTLKYSKHTEDFVTAFVKDKTNKTTVIYFEKKFVEIE